MARKKQFLDIDVLTAAKQRIHHICDTHDSIAVCFSGGKDSLVVLHLAREVLAERGIKKVNVVFRDEELIPDTVINFIDHYRQQEWVNMIYFAVPLLSSKYILGRSYEYVQWDPKRPHVRPIPAHAIKLEQGDDRVFDQYSMDEYTATFFKGKVALLTGIRAAESIMRFRASVNKLNENYINASSSGRVSLCKPIFDWEENDVFRFFYDYRVAYCPIYDHQMLAGRALRVATPLHAEQSKRLGQLRSIDPDFYNRVLKVFPEMEVQDRYYSSLDRDAIKAKYGADMAGVRSYIDDNITDEEQHKAAVARWKTIAAMHKNAPDAYPAEHALKYFMAGTFKRMLLPVNKNSRK